jgi:hypothetical protein
VLSCAVPLSAAEKGPDVDAILHKFVQALGGREAWSKIESRQLTGEMETMGAQGEYISTAKSPNLSFSRVKHPGIGVFDSGFDGSTAWTKGQAKVIIKKGSELERARREADFFQELHLNTTYPGLTFVGSEVIQGEAANILESKDPVIGKCRFYFGDSTGLLLRREKSFVNPEGKQMSSETEYSDYRKVDGIRFPFRQQVTVRVRGEVVNESKMVVKEVKHNLRIENGIFKMPSN